MGKCSNLVVFSTAYLALVIHVGLLVSLSALFIDIMETFEILRARAAIVQSVATGLYGICGFFNGTLISRIGSRKACILGTLLSSFGMSVSFAASSVVVLYVGVGVFMGIGVSMIYISSCTIVGQYFQDKKVLLLLSFHATGSGVGGIGYPYLLPYLNKQFGLRGTLLICGGVLLQGLVFALCWTPEHDKLKAVNDTMIKDDIKAIDNDKTITEQESTETSNAHTVTTNSNTSEVPMNTPNTNISAYSMTTTDNNVDKCNANHELENTCNSSDFKVTHVFKSEAVKNGENERTTQSTLRKIITVLKMQSFIPFIAAQAISFSATVVYLYFIVDIITDIGYSNEGASGALMAFNIAGTIGRLIPGVMLQGTHLPALLVPAVACVLGIIGYLALIFGDIFSIIIVASIVIGLSSGILVTSFPVTSLRLVGEGNLPIALGVSFTVAGTLNALSGPLNGLIRDVTGTYSIVLWEAVGCFTFAIFILGCAQWSRYRNK